MSMTKPKMFEKPLGVKDYLPEAVERLRNIELNVLECMSRWGYRQMITPTLEYYDTVGAASSTSDAKLFKLLDKRGVTLVLRSDSTAPIARVVASVLKEEPLPLRLSYHANVFRAMEDEAGRDAEFYQTGVELVGDASAEADAEIIALSIASLRAAGIEDFKIAVGHVGFLNGLFNETLPGHPEAQELLKQSLLQRDMVGYQQQIRELPLSQAAKEELKSIMRLRGGRDVCTLAQDLSRDPLAIRSLDHLCRIWDVLCDYGVSEHILIDLTMIGDFSYYTGMTFEGYAAELGFPVCSGGRYDNLLQQFGRPAPATGFALKTNRILEVLEGKDIPRKKRVLILFDNPYRKEALLVANELRTKDGYMVEARKLQDPAALEAVQKALTNGLAERIALSTITRRADQSANGVLIRATSRVDASTGAAQQPTSSGRSTKAAASDVDVGGQRFDEVILYSTAVEGSGP